MACSACLSKSNSNTKVSLKKASVLEVNTECDYTTELMVIWNEKLKCIKQNNLFSEIGFNKYKINFALGTVQSAINTGNACYFKKQLDEISIIILTLININKC